MNCTRCSGKRTFNNEECVKCGGKGKIAQNDYTMFLITKNVLQNFKIKKDKNIKKDLEYQN
jgi:DnaJ-class molecular chaperone